MPSEWRLAKIEEVAEKVAMGPFGSSIKVETFVSSGVPVISGQHLHGFKVDDSIEFNFVSYDHADRLKNANVQHGDIIFTHAGNIGKVAYIPKDSKFERYVISQRQFYMRPDRSKIIPEFVVAYFKTPEGQHKLLANKSQVGVPSIAQPVTYLRTIEIPVPPLPEQHAIAHILGTLDDKIELNGRMNETLEAMARAIFKSWFIDFNPVMDNALRAGNPIPSSLAEKAARRRELLAHAKAKDRAFGIPTHTAALFSDFFVDSELGPIPAEWNMSTLGELIDLSYGKALKEENRRPGSIPVYGSNGQVGWHDEALARGPGIIVGRKGNPGTVVWVPSDFFAIDTTFYVVLKGKCRSLPFIFCALSRQDLQLLAADSAVPGLNRNFVYSNFQLIPPPAVLEVFDRIAETLFDKQFQNGEESRTLAALRDVLLPKLISGDLGIKDAHRIISEVP